MVRSPSGRGACVADQRQCGCRIEPAIIERAACDRAGEFLGARRQQRLHVVERGKATRRDDGYRDALGELDRRIEIEALQQAVAGNIGEDDRGDPGILEPLRDFEGGDLRGLGPAFDRDLAVAGVETDRDAAGKFPGRTFHKLGIAHRRGADDDPRNALGEPGLDRVQVADAAAELYRHGDRLEHRLDRQRIDRLAGKGAVEIDHMQIFEALRGEAPRLRRRVEVEHRGARHVALFETHALAVLQIDRGKENHGFHFKKFEISASPKRWLFSG